MLDKIPQNFKNRYKNQENGLKCDLCPAEMTQNHCLICPERQELRKDLDMENLDHLVMYFRQILNERSTWTNKAWDARLGCWSTFVNLFCKALGRNGLQTHIETNTLSSSYCYCYCHIVITYWRQTRPEASGLGSLICKYVQKALYAIKFVL